MKFKLERLAKFKFERLARFLVIGCVVCLGFGIWAAETSTNAPATQPNVAPTPPETNAFILEGRYLTFGLDRIPWVNRTALMGEPLWKYLASLVYMILALCVTR